MDEFIKSDIIKAKIRQEYKNIIDDISSYDIDIEPKYKEDGEIDKIKYIIEKLDFHITMSYVLRYNVDFSYSKEEFEIDAYNKLVVTIRKIQELTGLFEKKNSKYRKLNIGDRFGFGYYCGTPLSWKVIDKNGNDLMVIADKVICKRRFHRDNSSNRWDTSEIREWLNNKFYNEAFDEGEREIIKLSHISTSGCDDTDDKIFLLSKEESELFFKEKGYSIKVSDWWWLRSPGGNSQNAAINLAEASGDKVKSNVDNNEGAVCPAFWVSC